MDGIDVLLQQLSVRLLVVFSLTFDLQCCFPWLGLLLLVLFNCAVDSNQHIKHISVFMEHIAD